MQQLLRYHSLSSGNIFANNISTSVSPSCLFITGCCRALIKIFDLFLTSFSPSILLNDDGR